MTDRLIDDRIPIRGHMYNMISQVDSDGYLGRLPDRKVAVAIYTGEFID